MTFKQDGMIVTFSTDLLTVTRLIHGKPKTIKTILQPDLTLEAFYKIITNIISIDESIFEILSD